MEYEYVDGVNIGAGDVVIGNYGDGKIHLVNEVNGEIVYYKGKASNDLISDVKLIKTKPGSAAKVGDTVICIDSYHKHKECEKGVVYKVNTSDNYINGYHKTSFLVLCQKEEFTYPMWFKHRTSLSVYKYLSLCDCVSVKTGGIFKNTTKHTHEDMIQVDEPTISFEKCAVKDTCSHYDMTNNCNGCGNNQNKAYPEMGTDSKMEKETLMKENIKVELEITPDMIKKVIPKKPKSDLQNENKRPFMAKVFDSAGKIVKKRLFAKTQAKLDTLVDDWLQDNPKDEVHCFARTQVVRTKRLKLETTKVKAK